MDDPTGLQAQLTVSGHLHSARRAVRQPLALHLQSSLVLNTLLPQRVRTEPAWAKKLLDEDRAG
ncbi:hypothetical protein [Streptomyces sp. NBC_01431]|uniref:hypothetical protein n=1 Tax=Streptomyces sp. NBC_01431 TaxID=2903863 RepID=UPI002E320B3E|nr:hypothetical protein [Streptomyces sp. NBC_01431]